MKQLIAKINEKVDKYYEEDLKIETDPDRLNYHMILRDLAADYICGARDTLSYLGYSVEFADDRFPFAKVKGIYKEEK